jgi:hypothetical protein
VNALSWLNVKQKKPNMKIQNVVYTHATAAIMVVNTDELQYSGELLTSVQWQRFTSKSRNKGTTTVEWNTVKCLSFISEGTMEGRRGKMTVARNL